MAKKRTTATQETALFETGQYSQGIGDTERSHYDPTWDEIILDSEITQIETTGQTTLFYDSTTEPPTPEEFSSKRAYNKAYEEWEAKHPELVNHGFKKDSERVIGDDRGFKVGDKLFSNHAFGEMIIEVIKYPSIANDYISYDYVETKNSSIINCSYLSKDLQAPNKDNYCSESLYQKAVEKYEKFCNQDKGFEVGDRLIPANTKEGIFIVEKADSCIHLGIIINTNESGFFVDWLNFGDSPKDINFLRGSNCFNSWERDQLAIDKLAIAPQPLVDKFLSLNPGFSINLSKLEPKKEDKPEFKEGCVYLHSSGKKAKITKLFKTTDNCRVYLEGEVVQQKISLSELSLLPSEELVREKENELKKGDVVFSKQLRRSGEITHVGKSGITIDWVNWIKLAYSFSQVEELKLSRMDYSCLPCSTATQEQDQPPLQVTNLESELANLSKLTPQPNEFSSTDSQISPSIQTSKIIKGNSNSTTSTGLASHVQEQVTPESVQGLTTQNQECGSIHLERSQLNNLSSLLLNNPEELLTTDLEQFLGDSEWSNIVGKIPKSYQLRNLERPINESESLLLPTPTTYPKGSGKCRPAGTNRLEQKLRPYINKGDKLHPAVPGWMMGFPIGWVEYPLADTGEILSVQLPLIQPQATTSKTEENVLISTVEPLHPNKQKLSLNESAILQNSQELQPDTLIRILEGRYKGEYGVVREIQEESVIVDAFGKSLVVVKNGNFAIASKLKIESYREGSYLLNGRVGKVIESYDLEYFVLQYSDVAKCYFWGQDDEFIKGLAIAPQHLIDEFLRETNPIPETSLKKKKTASGSLAPYIENKKIKDGTIVTYPRVQGERDKSNPLHWKWGYYYEIKVNGEWKNRSLPTPARIVSQVKLLIENNHPVEEIKEFILQAKNKKGGAIIN